MPVAYAAPLVAAVVAILLIAWMLKAQARLPLDVPNQRSLHTQPVPRSGGIAIMLGIFTGFAMLRLPLAIVLPAALLVAVSHMDDLRGLPVSIRIAAQILAAVSFAYGALQILPWPLLVPAVIGIVWVTNLYNFMDGSDGLAGGMSVFGFGFLAIGAWQGGDEILTIASLAIAAAAAAFLPFNFPPARIFMGDAGSVPLGFLAAAISLAGWRDGDWPLWFPMIVFSPFIVDATLTLLKRTLHGERVWEAHRKHYYQRLVQMGWGHRGTALAEYALALGCGAAALWSISQPAYVRLAVMLALAVLYAVLIVWLDLAWRRHEKSNAGFA